jgi:Fe-S cluster biogenesis protein NfuA
VDPNLVADAVGELGALLRADGADLELLRADPAAALVEVALRLEGVSCRDCVLPPAQLQDVVARAVGEAVPDEFELVMHDPRLTAPARTTG